MSEPYDAAKLPEYIDAIKDALELLYDLGSSHTKAILVIAGELQDEQAENRRLVGRIRQLEERLTTVSNAASRGESAYWMQQPLGGIGNEDGH